ncbi:MAG: peptidoglycan bridge formation glycyltransferase FemA/FemB family protein [Candidatus Paceibacterota bacterium]|jgi:lipid II:glycine glycyltransferase (peptidoglycan interpeptide bridge formation enzyme)
MSVYNFKKINSAEYAGKSASLKLADVPLTQCPFYGEWQENIGSQVFRFLILEGDDITGLAQAIKFNVSLGKNYIYIPHGPIMLKTPTDTFLSEFQNFVLSDIVDKSTFFVRFDIFEAGASGENNLDINLPGNFYKLPYSEYGGDFQQKFERVIGLGPKEEDLRFSLHRTAKYLINKSTRHGIEISFISGPDIMTYLDDFCRLMSQTAGRDRFSLHSKKYYEAIFNDMARVGGERGFLTVGKKLNKVVLTNLNIIHGQTVTFLFGGADETYLDDGLSYLAQWESVKKAKKDGHKIYSFGAVVPPGKDLIFKGYVGWKGLTSFKDKFGGRVLEYGNVYDIIVESFWYRLFSAKRRLRLWKKRIFRFK